MLFAIPPKLENVSAVGWALTGSSLLLSKMCINGRMGTEETNPLLPGRLNVWCWQVGNQCFFGLETNNTKLKMGQSFFQCLYTTKPHLRDSQSAFPEPGLYSALLCYRRLDVEKSNGGNTWPSLERWGGDKLITRLSLEGNAALELSRSGQPECPAVLPRSSPGSGADRGHGALHIPGSALRERKQPHPQPRGRHCLNTIHSIRRKRVGFCKACNAWCEVGRPLTRWGDICR